MSASQLDPGFCEVMDAAPVMIWVSGADKGCVWFNRPWLTFTGRGLAQEMGNGWSEGVHRDDFDRCIELYTSHFDERKDFRMQYRLRRHNGAYRWIDDTGMPRFAAMVRSLATSAHASISTSIENCNLIYVSACWKTPN